MALLIIIPLVLIYILSIIFIHLYYRVKFIEHYTKSKSNYSYRKFKPTLNGFYSWANDNDDVEIHPFFFWVPVINTLAIILLFLFLIMKKIGNIKFI